MLLDGSFSFFENFLCDFIIILILDFKFFSRKIFMITNVLRGASMIMDQEGNFMLIERGRKFEFGVINNIDNHRRNHEANVDYFELLDVGASHLGHHERGENLVDEGIGDFRIFVVEVEGDLIEAGTFIRKSDMHDVDLQSLLGLLSRGVIYYEKDGIEENDPVVVVNGIYFSVNFGEEVNAEVLEFKKRREVRDKVPN
jgi:hypothetical protein